MLRAYTWSAGAAPTVSRLMEKHSCKEGSGDPEEWKPEIASKLVF